MGILESLINSSLVGSLAGTAIAGTVTVRVFKRQIGYDKDTKRMEELEKYLKINSQFESILKHTLQELKLLKSSINEDDNKRGIFSDSTKTKGEKVNELIGRTIIESEKVKLFDIPYEIYYEYIGSIELLKLIKVSTIFDALRADTFKTDWLYMNPNNDRFFDEISRLEVSINNIIAYRENADEELSNLKKKWSK